MAQEIIKNQPSEGGEYGDPNPGLYQGQGALAYGVLHRWFADVSGLRLRSKPGGSCLQPRPSGKRSWRITWRCGRTRNEGWKLMEMSSS